METHRTLHGAFHPWNFDINPSKIVTFEKCEWAHGSWSWRHLYQYLERDSCVNSTNCWTAIPYIAIPVNTPKGLEACKGHSHFWEGVHPAQKTTGLVLWHLCLVRPLSMEHILANQIMGHLDEHNILSVTQNGFRKKHACSSARSSLKCLVNWSGRVFRIARRSYLIKYVTIW